MCMYILYMHDLAHRFPWGVRAAKIVRQQLLNAPGAKINDARGPHPATHLPHSLVSTVLRMYFGTCRHFVRQQRRVRGERTTRHPARGGEAPLIRVGSGDSGHRRRRDQVFMCYDPEFWTETKPRGDGDTFQHRPYPYNLVHSCCTGLVSVSLSRPVPIASSTKRTWTTTCRCPI